VIRQPRLRRQRPHNGSTSRKCTSRRCITGCQGLNGTPERSIRFELPDEAFGGRNPR